MPNSGHKGVLLALTRLRASGTMSQTSRSMWPVQQMAQWQEAQVLHVLPQPWGHNREAEQVPLEPHSPPCHCCRLKWVAPKLQHSLQFLHQQNSKTLQQLHQEIDRLK